MNSAVSPVESPQSRVGIIAFINQCETLVVKKNFTIKQLYSPIEKLVKVAFFHVKFSRSRIEFINFNTTGIVVLGNQTQRISLNAQVCIFGYKHNIFVTHIKQRFCASQNNIVRRAFIYTSEKILKLVVRNIHSERTAAIQANAFTETALTSQSIKVSGYRPGISSYFSLIPLKSINFLNDNNGNNQVVFLKAEY